MTGSIPLAGLPSRVQRVWSVRGLNPHLVKTFKLSDDPRFEEKLIDVVGLYLDPPDNSAMQTTGRRGSEGRA